MQTLPRDPDRAGNLGHLRPAQHRPDRVQPLLNLRQHHQSHSRSPLATAPRTALRMGPTRPGRVNHQLIQNCQPSPATGQEHRTVSVEPGSSRSRAGPARPRGACPRFAAGRAANLPLLNSLVIVMTEVSAKVEHKRSGWYKSSTTSVDRDGRRTSAAFRHLRLTRPGRRRSTMKGTPSTRHKITKDEGRAIVNDLTKWFP